MFGGCPNLMVRRNHHDPARGRMRLQNLPDHCVGTDTATAERDFNPCVNELSGKPSGRRDPVVHHVYALAGTGRPFTESAVETRPPRGAFGISGTSGEE
jgi:hypothetical protein